MLLFGLGENAARAAAVQGVKDLCIPEPPSQNRLSGGNTGLRQPAPRQSHSLSGYIGISGYGSNLAVISPQDICARPGRRSPRFVLNWRYAEVFIKSLLWFLTAHVSQNGVTWREKGLHRAGACGR